ncbi:alpha-amylase [Pseudoalteromonas sp. SR44-5]|uniref:sugar phosphorylase n=1 Tax=Pseudoalteromonas TaxID=53246 RepID=UPI0016006B1C|nr:MULTISPECIES: sugar phosphorylase [unclassified Pseudoalteromonas]MBB1301609.1 alpha-amylase [Pseudoalteromonas sp. SR44-8]MBB1342335.1 alpha-amylase [Pseudoalteromonas sp. SR45-6]MBB1367595.1 alpha-amylase [Pseudoalteromonas sp. SR44-5]MBB1416627.1 alpha-amylase [Pseudoalteromonas sp. SG44-1]MBB1424432.1 alpha-amylase [Pseudoalteromonas sp. SG43-7]
MSKALFEQRVEQHLTSIYEGVDLCMSIDALASMLITTMLRDDPVRDPTPHKNRWDQQDVILIAYGDSIMRYRDADQAVAVPSEPPLHTLHRFMKNQCAGTINALHILPFYPYSSDEGFSVMNYVQVNESLGSWDDIQGIAQDVKLMADLVINHCSSRSRWFENFIQGKEPGLSYFKTASLNDDLSDVVRPRTSPLLNTVQTALGERHVWCTFSPDQVDLDFANPLVLNEFVGIIRHYLDNGIKIFRLDAVAFLWKELNTSCINLPQTHEVIRLLRTLIEHVEPSAVIITETNIPNRENLSYFGNANEAHCIYNFSLPPLLLHTLLSGDSKALKHWMMSMPPAQNGTAYFNFIASHDGIGLRPVEGLLDEDELGQMVNTVSRFGAKVSMRTANNGTSSPYELNIALFDALQGTHKGVDKWGLQRFTCAHAIMFALEGIPGLYIHSLLGTTNDYERFENSQHNRCINRHRWQESALLEKLADQSSHHYHVFTQINNLLAIRKQQDAFHPNATQFTLHLTGALFGFWRQSIDRRQSVFCVYNISDEPQTLLLADLNLIDTEQWFELISAQAIEQGQQSIELAPYQPLWLSNRQ